jgi:hypothetical protein
MNAQAQEGSMFRPADSGIASALVNTSQQVGGSVGTPLLNTLATTAAASFVRTHVTGPAVLARATVHGNSVAFWAGAAIFAFGAVVCGYSLSGEVRARLPLPSRCRPITGRSGGTDLASSST